MGPQKARHGEQHQVDEANFMCSEFYYRKDLGTDTAARTSVREKFVAQTSDRSGALAMLGCEVSQGTKKEGDQKGVATRGVFLKKLHCP